MCCRKKKDNPRGQPNKASAGVARPPSSANVDPSSDEDVANVNVQHFPPSKLHAEGDRKKNTSTKNAANVNKREGRKKSTKQKKDEFQVNEDVAAQVMNSTVLRRQREASVKKKINDGFYVTESEADKDDTLGEYPEPEEEKTDGDAADPSKKTGKRKKKRKKTSIAPAKNTK